MQKGHGVNRKGVSSETYAKIGGKKELAGTNTEDTMIKILNMGADSEALGSVEKINAEIEDLNSKKDEFAKAKQRHLDKIETLRRKLTGEGAPSGSISSLSKQRGTVSAGCGLEKLERESNRLRKLQADAKTIVNNLNPKLSAIGLDVIHERSLEDLRTDIDRAGKGRRKTSSNYQTVKDDVLKQLVSLENCQYVARHLEGFMDHFRKELGSTQAVDESGKRSGSA